MSWWLIPACGATTAARGPFVTVSTEAPPPPRSEPVEERDGEVRVRGVWQRRGDDWVWRSGRWQRARAGLVWRDAHWAFRAGRWHWVEGHWQRAP
ncbi:MAG TPA: hypothetical protein VMZ28_02960 [Kofleriaceae bacterium]|nr:hypothetical protein [Kofleriaceae bacterium]